MVGSAEEVEGGKKDQLQFAPTANETQKTRLTLSFSDVVPDGDASELLERPDVEVRLLPLRLGSKGVLERLGLDNVGTLQEQAEFKRKMENKPRVSDSLKSLTETLGERRVKKQLLS